MCVFKTPHITCTLMCTLTCTLALSPWTQWHFTPRLFNNSPHTSLSFSPSLTHNTCLLFCSLSLLPSHHFIPLFSPHHSLHLSPSTCAHTHSSSSSSSSSLSRSLFSLFLTQTASHSICVTLVGEALSATTKNLITHCHPVSTGGGKKWDWGHKRWGVVCCGFTRREISMQYRRRWQLIGSQINGHWHTLAMFGPKQCQRQGFPMSGSYTPNHSLTCVTSVSIFWVMDDGWISM